MHTRLSSCGLSFITPVAEQPHGVLGRSRTTRTSSIHIVDTQSFLAHFLQVFSYVDVPLHGLDADGILSTIDGHF